MQNVHLIKTSLLVQIGGEIQAPLACAQTKLNSEILLLDFQLCTQI